MTPEQTRVSASLLDAYSKDLKTPIKIEIIIQGDGMNTHRSGLIGSFLHPASLKSILVEINFLASSF
jgi:hypothetical protein